MVTDRQLVCNNDNSSNIDPCQHSGRLHVARAAANIDKVEIKKSLNNFIESVFSTFKALSSVREHLAEVLCSIFLTDSTVNHLMKCLSLMINPVM